MKDVEQILTEKTKAYTCVGKTVEVTEYDLTAGDIMLGVNKSDSEEKEQPEVDVRLEGDILYPCGT